MRITKTIYAVVAALLLCVAAQAKTNGRIAFERSISGSTDIFVMNADGSGQINLTETPFNESQAAWSPDGSRIVFVRAPQVAGETADLYVMDADGHNLKRLTSDDAVERFPAWSPDGAHIAYARAEAQGGFEQIYIVSADGSGMTNLTKNLRGDHSHPTWSPDSKRIAFTSSGGNLNNYEIWTMNADGTGPAQLTDGAPAGSYAPAWSPDGKLIAFQRDYEIYTVDPVSGAETNLTLSSNSQEDTPAWSPDGRQLVFSRFAEGNLDIYAMKSDGTDVRRLTTDAQMDNLPAWQPAATQVAFVSTRDGNREIYLMAEDGTTPQRLTTNAAADTEPALSPDGTRVAFVSTRDGGSLVFVMNADGTGLKRVTNPPEAGSADDESPAWSPDGTRLVFAARYRDGDKYQLYVVGADGSGLKKISDGSDHDLSPSWSPDGTRVAFQSLRKGDKTYDIYSMNADGSGLTNLTHDDVDDSDPVWSPDGTRIAYVRSCCSSAEIYVVNADGSNPTRLTNNTANDRDPAWSPDSTRVVYASLRNAISNVSTYDLYATAADGSVTTRLTTDGLENRQPSWSLRGTAAPPVATYSIQLKVLEPGEKPLAGVKLTLGGGATGTQTTDAGGFATFANLPAGGTYTVNASKEGYTFKPESRTFENLLEDTSGSLEAFRQTFKWGGRVADVNGQPLAGVTVQATGDFVGSAETDEAGAYSLAIPYGSNVTLKAAHDSYTFNPVAVTTRVAADGTTNFTGTLIVYKVRGRVTNAAKTGIQGVRLRLGGTREGFTTTDAGGNYEFTNLPKGGTYTVTPEQAGLTFTPTSRQIDNLGGDQTAADFQLALTNATISGHVRDAGGRPVGGVAVLVANQGGQPSPYYTDAGGFYSAKVLAGASYTVTASRAHYTFAPASIDLGLVGADRTADFTATLATHGFTGRVLDAEGHPLSGVKLVLGGSAQEVVTTDAEGFFNFTNLPAGGSYTLTPSLEGYTFEPQSQSIDDLGAETVVNFHAAAVVQPARVQFSAPSFKTDEGARLFTVTVTRTGDPAAEGTVFYETLDGTASERSDYTTALGTLSFAAGETEKTFDVLLTDDAYAEGPESLTLKLSDATGGLGLGETAQAALDIADNDAADSPSNPAADAEFFVRQHYHDFLNREPDAQGLKFWADQLTKCDGDAGCLDAVRQNVSAAFFLSIEFQQTGYLVHRLQRVSYGGLPRYRDLVRDTQEIGRGVVVGQGDWKERLEANKQAFVAEWAARAEFEMKYGAMANAQFVDALWSNVGLTPPAAERDGLVAGLESGALTRADALGRVAESEAVVSAEFNRAFVLMEYFGYLRRNPNDRPDADMSGFRFWLDKFNSFGGDFHRAEMVRSFIVSLEYQRRFGQ